MAIPPNVNVNLNVTVVGHYTITWTLENVGGKPEVKMCMVPMPKDIDEAMQLCAQIIVQRDAIMAQKDGIIKQLVHENVLLRGEKEQLLKEKDELRTKLVALQAVLESLKQQYEILKDKCESICSSMEEIKKGFEAIRLVNKDIELKEADVATKFENQEKELKSLQAQLSAMDLKVTITGVCTWIEEARLIILHKLGYRDADHLTLAKEWHTLSKRKQSDERFQKDFNDAVEQLFELNADEWKKVSYDFYHKQHHACTLIQERPSADDVLKSLAMLPQPYDSDEYKVIFCKLIPYVAEQVQTAEQICA